MVVFVVVSSFLLGLYLFIVLLATYGWFLREPIICLSNNRMSNLKGVSIVIPFRNEAHNLPKLISQLLATQTHSIFVEFIFVNDHSTDQWSDTVLLSGISPNVIFINSEKSGKKQAIFEGVSRAKYDIILTTDADCVPDKGWIVAMYNKFVDQKCQLLFGPVTLVGDSTLLGYFQSIDYAAMAAIGGGSAMAGQPFICSGANLMFSKSCYLSVSDLMKMEYASGDDVFLLHAFKKKGYVISFCNSSAALVNSSTEQTFNALVKQRVRWGAKAKGYTDAFSILVSLVVFLLSILMVGSLATLYTSIYIPILLFFIKMVADGLFLFAVLPFFKIRFRWLYFIMIQLFYPFWIVFIAVLGFRSTTLWKGRC